MIRMIQCALAAILCATIGGGAATISGLVSLAGDPSQPVTPVQGAFVVAYKVLTNHSGLDSLVMPRLDSVLTDAEGAYSIARLDAGRLYLESGMKGYKFANPYSYATLRSDSGHYIVNFRFRDTAQGQVKVRVLRDSAQGTGLAGATLVLSGAEYTDTGKTDANGQYTFTHVIPASYRLKMDTAGFLESFDHPGNISNLSVTRLKTASVLVVLWPPDAKGAIAGKVAKASEGSAIPGAKVALSLYEQSDTARYAALDSATTGSDGSYKFSSVPVHRGYALTVRSTGFQTATARFTVSFHETFQAPIPLVPANMPGDSGGTVAGVVTDSAGNGLAGTILALVSGGSSKWDSVETDPMGRFLFPKARQGTYLITAARPGYRSKFTNDFDVANGQTRVVFLTMGITPIPGAVAKAKGEAMRWHPGSAGGIVLEVPDMPLAGQLRVYDIRGAIRFSGALPAGAIRMEIPWSRGRPGYVVLARGKDFHRLAIPATP